MARAVPAVSRAFDILELFLREPALSAPEITARLGLPRTTVHELVNTLVEREYLAEAGDTHRFRLGVRSFELGSAYGERLDVAQEGWQVAEQVAARCQETVHVAVRDGVEVLYVAKVDSTHPVRMVSAVGRRLPAHCTAVGKVLLSALDRADFDALYPRGQRLPTMTARSVSSATALWRALARVRESGVGSEYCESNESVACVAAPVYDRRGAMAAAMSISVPVLRWTEERTREWEQLIRDGAADLSRRLGHPAPPP